MPDLRLTYRPDYRHVYDAAAVLHHQRFSRAQNRRARLVIFGSMFGGGMLAAAIGIGLNIWNPAIPALPVILALLFLVALFHAGVIAPWQRRMSIAAIEAASPTTPMDFVADDQGLHWRGAHMDFTLGWSGVEAVFLTPGALAFMHGALALVLPLDAFESDAQRRELVELCLARMPEAAARKSRDDKKLRQLLAGPG
ncbi:YcxB family protein [Devosia elaeis]|uniref:YcxB-like protein domain-containing protein n=1 Tax=Devosia elaeis TaxID=1770058 RepID=A0A178I3S2_9HYPH|nr:YcxB family protein [Devosia elaeis]OAM82296.1 hypothetical protein A3840_01205 [Devosia elaeis]